MGKNALYPHNSGISDGRKKFPLFLKNFDKSFGFPLGALSVKTK